MYTSLLVKLTEFFFFWVCVEVQKVEVLTVKELDKIYSLVKAKLKLLHVVKEDRSLELQLSSKDTTSLINILVLSIKFLHRVSSTIYIS